MKFNIEPNPKSLSTLHVFAMFDTAASQNNIHTGINIFIQMQTFCALETPPLVVIKIPFKNLDGHNAIYLQYGPKFWQIKYQKFVLPSSYISQNSNIFQKNIFSCPNYGNRINQLCAFQISRIRIQGNVASSNSAKMLLILRHSSK